MMNTNKVGKRCKLSNPQSEDEAKALFIVSEDNGDRLIIQLVCDLPFAPTELVRPSDITILE